MIQDKDLFEISDKYLSETRILILSGPLGQDGAGAGTLENCE